MTLSFLEVILESAGVIIWQYAVHIWPADMLYFVYPLSYKYINLSPSFKYWENYIKGNLTVWLLLKGYIPGKTEPEGPPDISSLQWDVAIPGGWALPAAVQFHQSISLFDITHPIPVEIGVPDFFPSGLQVMHCGILLLLMSISSDQVRGVVNQA